MTRPLGQKVTTYRDRDYLDYIRALPCHRCAGNECGATGGPIQRSDAHHVVGNGMSIKNSDTWTVPLGRRCHQLVQGDQEYTEPMLRAALGYLTEYVRALKTKHEFQRQERAKLFSSREAARPRTIQPGAKGPPICVEIADEEGPF